jgi:hypothetical protein
MRFDIIPRSVFLDCPLSNQGDAPRRLSELQGEDLLIRKAKP